MSHVETPYQWLSRDPRNGNVVAYAQPDTIQIENAYQGNPKGSYEILLGGMKFTIDFLTMTQRNSSGGSRQVIRRVAHASSKPQGDSLLSCIKDLAVPTIVKATEAIEANDKLCDCLTENISLLRHTYQKKSTDSLTVEELVISAKITPQPVVDILTTVLKLMTFDLATEANNDEIQDRIQDLMTITVGQPVPAYFANSKGEGIARRKYLSVLGLRNMSIHGHEIFSELSWNLFSSNPKAYSDGTGVVKMKLLTGNVVDLDTVVLNCGTQLKEINEIRRKEKKAPFADAQSFFSSEDATSMARHQSEALIQTFINDLRLDKKAIKGRKLDLDVNTPLPIASNNDQRGMWPVWGYANVGVFSYHANVPHMPDVIGALIRAPFQLARAFIMCLTQSGVYNPGATDLNLNCLPELRKLLITFFDEAVNDSCFNAKWKQIEAFVEKMHSVDSIDTIISNLQASNQAIFSKELFDNDDEKRTNELQAMVKLVSGTGIKGRDMKTQQIRLICKQDLENWILRTN